MYPFGKEKNNLFYIQACICNKGDIFQTIIPYSYSFFCRSLIELDIYLHVHQFYDILQINLTIK